MLWILVAVLLMIWIAIYRWKNRKLIALGNQISTKTTWLPIVGHGHKFLGTDEDRMIAFDQIGKEAYGNGGIIGHWQGNLLYTLIADPEVADILLKTCLEKVDLMKMFRVLLGNGNIFAPVSIWRPRRKILAPTFRQKNLNSFVEVFSRQSSIMVDQLRTAAGKGIFSVWKYLTTYTMDSVCETALGIRVNTQLEPELPFLQAFENCCQIDAKRICQPWLYNDTVNKILNTRAFLSYARSKELIWQFMNKIIATKWESLKKENHQGSAAIEANKKGWKTFLELLIESPAGYGNVELREETLVIVLAGTDTSAVGAAFTMIMLGKYPDIQEKVYEEIQDIFGNSDRPVTHEDLPRLKYLDAVVRESLRLYPPVPFITRKVEKDVKLPSGVTLVEGCNLIFSIWSIHRNPKYWGADAEMFRPERFIDTPLTHPAAFIPFSHGPRSCLGYQYAMMSMKTALTTILRRYRIIANTSKNGMSEAVNGTCKSKNGTNEAINGTSKPKNGFSGAINGTCKSKNGLNGTINGTCKSNNGLNGTINGTCKSKNGLNEANDDSRKPNLRVKFDIMLKHVNNFEIQLELRS